VLDPRELAEVAATFGVSDAQVRRDHLISHLLVAMADLALPITFFGGTALARTHLSDPDAGARLSEDIDLYSPQRRATAAVLDEQLPPLLRREFPGTRWDPALSAVRSTASGQLVTRDGLRVRVQLLDSSNEHQDLAGWPAEERAVTLRYADLPGGARLEVPTLESFAAMKTIAWADRRAARDLYDLAGLAALGALTAEVAARVHRATGWRVTRPTLQAPPASHWDTELAHQTRSLPTAQECLGTVLNAYAQALDWPPPPDPYG
jgi:predicted nucleotidyltransferase component of viral defense system